MYMKEPRTVHETIKGGKLSLQGNMRCITLFLYFPFAFFLFTIVLADVGLGMLLNVAV